MQHIEPPPPRLKFQPKLGTDCISPPNFAQLWPWRATRCVGVQHADGGAAPLGQAEAGWDFFECSQAVLQPTLGYKLWNKSFSLDKLAARGNGMHIVGDALHHIEEVAAGRLPVDVLVAFPTCTYVCKLARVWRRRKRLEYTNGRSVAFATARLLLQNPQLDALGVEVFVENPADSEIAQVVGPPAQVVSCAVAPRPAWRRQSQGTWWWARCERQAAGQRGRYVAAPAKLQL